MLIQVLVTIGRGKHIYIQVEVGTLVVVCVLTHTDECR